MSDAIDEIIDELEVEGWTMHENGTHYAHRDALMGALERAVAKRWKEKGDERARNLALLSEFYPAVFELLKTGDVRGAARAYRDATSRSLHVSLSLMVEIEKALPEHSER